MLTSIIILAAGASTRLGKPKQLLEWQGISLLRRAAEAACGVKNASVSVVLGSSAATIKQEISDLPISIIENKTWQNGISSSIEAGLSWQIDKIKNALLMLCDQPFVDTALLEKMTTTQGNIIACRYQNGAFGVPVLFDNQFFGELCALKGDEGAKKLIIKHQKEVSFIDFPQGNIDIDTENDFCLLE